MRPDRKSTRLNSSHRCSSYAVFPPSSPLSLHDALPISDHFGPPLWHRNFNGSGRPTRNTEVGQACRIYNDFIGNIGIVGTPVIGPDRTMYFVTRMVEGDATRSEEHTSELQSPM